LPFAFIAFAAALGYFPLTSGGGPAPAWPGVVVVLFTLPFVAIGIGMLAAAFRAIAKSGRTVHVVTNRRLLDVYGGRRRGSDSCRSMPSIWSSAATAGTAAARSRSATA
jgi:hypothetical protein